MIWTVVFGDNPLAVAKAAGLTRTQVRTFTTRMAAEEFSALCRDAGIPADVQEHAISECVLNGA